jgi:hypothetical protein
MTGTKGRGGGQTKSVMSMYDRGRGSKEEGVIITHKAIEMRTLKICRVLRIKLV